MPRKLSDLIGQAIEVSQCTDNKVSFNYTPDNNGITFFVRPKSGPHRVMSLYLDHEFSGVGYTSDQIMDVLLQYSELEVEDEC